MDNTNKAERTAVLRYTPSASYIKPRETSYTVVSETKTTITLQRKGIEDVYKMSKLTGREVGKNWLESRNRLVSIDGVAFVAPNRGCQY